MRELQLILLLPLSLSLCLANKKNKKTRDAKEENAPPKVPSYFAIEETMDWQRIHVNHLTGNQNETKINGFPGHVANATVHVCTLRLPRYPETHEMCALQIFFFSFNFIFSIFKFVSEFLFLLFFLFFLFPCKWWTKILPVVLLSIHFCLKIHVAFRYIFDYTLTANWEVGQTGV